MGTKTWILMSYDQSPAVTLSGRAPIDRGATDAYVETLFPRDRLNATGSMPLTNAFAKRGEVHAACYDGLSILSCKELVIDHPSKLPPHLTDLRYGNETCSICVYSIVDWFAMSIWQSGTLVRSVSVSPDSGVMEDYGTRLDFEVPYWDGSNPATDPEDEDQDGYPLPFHPLDLADEALLNRFGYQIEGYPGQSAFDPDGVQLLTYRRKRGSSWWKFW